MTVCTSTASSGRGRNHGHRTVDAGVEVSVSDLFQDPAVTAVGGE